MTNWARTGYMIGAWLFVLSILVQVFLAGLALFATPRYWGTHVNFGYTGVHGAAALALLFAFLARLPRATIGRTAVPVLFSFILPAFTYFRDDFPAVAALHPVGAVILFWLALTVARQARALVPPPLGVAIASQSAIHSKEG